jgi:hypothetical protein
MAKKIKISNICEKYTVCYMNTFNLLRTLKAEFILG